MKLGSLFSGSGGFELGGLISGITPVWASEIEPFPIRVTSKRFPDIKHLGDISKVKGDEIEPVDVITFGSPCQDLSVAGKRAGLKHESIGDEETTRSGLFMEAVRIIKEMRCKTNGEYPTFAVWENVPGAYSSNKGEDFRAVLEELCKIKEESVSIPRPAKWLYAGEILGDGYSIAWRTLDAQYWGVPQRRRRIYLVADFRGQRASKILFEREGLRRDTPQGGTQGQSITTDAEGGVGTADKENAVGVDAYNQTLTGDKAKTLNSAASDADHVPCVTYAIDQQGGKGRANYAENVMPTLCSDSHGTPHAVAYTLKIRSGVDVDSAGKGAGKGPLIQNNMSATLGTSQDQYLFQPVMIENHPADSRVNIDNSGKCQTLTSRMGTGGGNVPMVMEEKSVVYDGSSVTSPVNAANPRPGDPCHTLGTDSRNYVVMEERPCLCMATQQGGAEIGENLCPTITAAAGMSGNNQPVICLQGNGIDRADTAGCNGKGWKEDTSYTLNTIDRPAVAYGIGNGQVDQLGLNHEKVGCLNCMHDQQAVMIDKEPQYIVRRLTPLECCRLQGFPDGWCSDLETPEPTEEDLIFWREVFETHRKIVTGAKKPKTDKQIIKWLKDPYADSAEYKLWGNGVALPNTAYVLQGIADELRGEGYV